jgi:hypothetical protein
MAEGDYEVGFRKPPKSGQFQKGKSGNPGGKRKRPLSLQEEFVRQLDRRLPIPTADGKKRTMQVRELTAAKIAQMVLNGNLSAIKLALDMEREVLSRTGAGVDGEVLKVTMNFDNEPVTYSVSKELYDYCMAIERGERPPHPYRFSH